MRCITIASGKGGVGRSTVTANLGIALSKLRKSTVIIDGTLTTPNLTLLFKLEKVVHTLNDLLSGNASIEDVTYDGPSGVKVIPAAVSLERIRKTRPERLPEVIKLLPKKTKFVLIDAPGGLRRETMAALRAGEELLIVTTPEVPAVSDAMKTRVAGELFGLKPIGIVLNLVHENKHGLGRREIKDLMNLPVLTEIPYDEEARKALGEGEPLIEREPRSRASKAIKELAKKIVKMKTKRK